MKPTRNAPIAHPAPRSRWIDPCGRSPLKPRLSKIARAVSVAFSIGAGASVWAQPPIPAGAVPVLRGVVSGAVVGMPVATATGNNLTINQSAQNAIIEWNSFNVGSGSVVRFNQPSSTAAALNRIYDSSPSTILGKVVANGQIYLINQNGIIFASGSQINVGGLIASTLNISNTNFLRSLTAETNQGVTPTFVGGYDDQGNPTAGPATATIQIGSLDDSASQAPQISAAAGGRIMMFAPQVINNSGVLSAANGQVILGAGNAIYLFTPGINTGNGFDPVAQGLLAFPYTGLRGYAVEVGSNGGAAATSSLVQNSGTIRADRGNVTLAALAVNQDGRVSASTAALSNGSIYLQAGTIDTTAAGTITATHGGTLSLSPGSVTETLLDGTDTTTVPSSQTVTTGLVYGIGKTVDVEGAITAPSGNIDLLATDAANSLQSRIYLGPTASLDVSGNWADVPFSQNLQTFTVTSNELADAPDQKAGILRGASVTVALNAPSTILDLSGYQQAQPMTLAEKATAGGSVSLYSQGDVITRLGSHINASGGGLHYASGAANVTLLLGADGKIYSINTAPEALRYVSILGEFQVQHPHWGVTENYTNLLAGFYSSLPSHTQGAAGGSITINPAGSLLLDGAMTAQSTIGAYQLTNAPRSGTLTIGPGSGQSSYGVANLEFSMTPTDLLGSDFSSSTPLPASFLSETLVPVAGLNGISTGQGGDPVAFDTVSIATLNNVVVPSGVSINMPPGGTLALSAASFDVAGRIFAPAGAVRLTSALSTAAANPQASVSTPDLGLQVETGGSISVAGLWLNNDSFDGSAVGPTLPFAMTTASSSNPSSTEQGGTITLSSQKTVLQAGSNLDVSGGGQIARSGKIQGGNAGTIALTADPSALNTGALTNIQLDGTLSGFSLTTGGILKIVADAIHIDDAQSASGGATLNLASGFFQQGGFSNFDLTGANGISLSPGTTIAPQVLSDQINASAAASLPTGGSLASITQPVRLPDAIRAAAGVELRATGPNAEPLSIPAGTTIVTDPGGSVTLQASNGMSIAGQILAPAGSINASVTGSFSGTTSGASDGPAVELELTPTGVLSTAGVFVAGLPESGTTNLVLGNVLSGGSISIDTTNSELVADAGSRIDVSGTAHVVDLATNNAANPYAATRVGSNAGVLAVTSTDGVLLNGTLAGAGGTDQSAGGTFVLNVTNRNNSNYAPSDDLGRRIVVTQTPGPVMADPNAIDADVALSQLSAGGFDGIHLTSENTIAFQGSIRSDFARGITLDAPQFLLGPGAQVDLEAGEIALQDSFAARVPDAVNGTNGTVAFQSAAPSPTIPTSSGNGTLRFVGDNVDLYGSLTINGAAQTILDSSHDIRLSGRQVSSDGSSLVGGVTTSGNLVLQGTQVYPTTRSSFDIAVVDQPDGDPSHATPVPGGSVLIQGNGSVASPVLSAGGNLAISASEIDQGGALRAPLGHIALSASDGLTLESGSLTSVSAAGEIIPYGETNAGVQWQYTVNPRSTDPTAQSLSVSVSAPPDKAISLAAPQINQKNGATVDVSGGGDILGVEFVPGSGGSKDILIQPNTYAIIPAANFNTAPYDPDILGRADPGIGYSPTQSRNSSIYDTIQIAAGGPVPAGQYVLLPGTYALLPGAYLVQLQTGSAYQNLQSNQIVSQPNGLPIVPGRLGVQGTGIVSATTVGVVVQPGQNALHYSDYNLFGSSFFAQQAAKTGTAVSQLPSDAGKLDVISTVPTSPGESPSLALSGLFLTDPASGGNSAQVDLSAENIAIVDQVGQAGIDSSYLQIDASQISKIDGNVLIGGIRTTDGNGISVTSTASNVLVANSSSDPLTAPELLLTASQSIAIESGASLSGTGKVIGESKHIAADSAGALIRLANSGPVTVTRSNPSNATGVITIDAGARLAADQSMLLDATQNTQIHGTLAVAKGGALSLDAPSIALGDTGLLSGFSGLSLTGEQLAQLSGLGSLALSTPGTINFYGPVTVGGSSLNSMTLDTAGLIGHAGSTQSDPALASLQAANFSLQNSSGNAYRTDALSDGTLNIAANHLTIGGGSKAITGFSSVNLTVSGAVMLSGTGELDVGSNLNVAAPQISGMSGASQSWNIASFGSNGPASTYSATLNAVPEFVMSADPQAGAAWTLNAASISDAIPLMFRSGSIALQSSGTAPGQGIFIATGALLDASGASRDFNGRTVVADAGSITLTSATTVDIGAGATLDVAGNSAGGNAGTFDVTSTSFTSVGTLEGTASPGFDGGHASFDLAALPNLTPVNDALNAGGFTGSRSIRARTGDITIGSTDQVIARQVVFTADSGSIDVKGTIDASGLSGGEASLFAQDGVTLEGGSLVSVRGMSTDISSSAADSNGGVVDIEARSGPLNFESGGTIDLRPGAKGHAGRAVLMAPRTSGNNGMLASLLGTIVSVNPTNSTAAPATVLVEGSKIYTSSSPSAGDVAGYASDVAGFLQNAAPSSIQIQGDAKTVLAAAVEVDAAADFTLGQSWDLTSGGWATGANLGGTLTIRAAGNLTVNSALGLPNDNLPNAPTWAIRLAGGSDLSSANPMAVLPLAQLQASNSGNVLLPTANSKIRNGTGDITLAAGNNFTLGDPQAVVYTLGLAAVPDTFGRYVSQGGDISITAQNDASGVSSEWITDWMRRPIVARGHPLTAGWWAVPENFQQNIGSFGGGDISIRAGRDVNDLSAMNATSGEVDPATGALSVYGGGDLAVTAGRDIVGGSYLVSLGTGTLKAVGSVGATTPTELYEMGLGSDPARQSAVLNVTAGQSIDLQSIADPTAMYLTKTNSNDLANLNNKSPLSQYSTFFTYAPTSTVNLLALGGDVTPGTAPAVRSGLSSIDNAGIRANDQNTSVLPPILNVVAWSGSISDSPSGLGPQLVTYPSPAGEASLLAGNTVRSLTLLASDLAPSSIPNVAAPGLGVTTVNQTALSTDSGVVAGAQTSGTATNEIVTRATEQPFVFDVQALSGDISNANFTFPGESRIWAEGNIDLSEGSGNIYNLENLLPADVSIVQANTGLITLGVGTIHVAGPGQLLVQAGKTIDLGTNLAQVSLEATGAQTNLSLPTATSARLTLLAGVTGNVNLSNLDIAFDGVRAAGELKSGTPEEHSAAARAAMAEFLGNAKVGAGDIDSFGTSVQTTQGSGIDLIAPEGNITVGLTNPIATGTNSAGNTTNGIVTNSGAINSFLSGNFSVNSGKVVTARGGDITIFTTNGNIDAGRGAKTSFTATTFTTKLVNNIPVTTVDPGVAGSGIRTVTTPAVPGDPSPPKAGNIFLFAPSGDVNAGEAGIASGGNIFIAAQLVLNPGEISASGNSVGVPQVQSGSLASSLVTSNAASGAGVDNAAQDAAQEAARAAAAVADVFKPSLLTVEVLGFGPNDCREGQAACLNGQ